MWTDHCVSLLSYSSGAKLARTECIQCSEQQKPLSARPWQATGGPTGASQARPPPPVAPAALPCTHAAGHVLPSAEHVGVAAVRTTRAVWSVLQSVSSLCKLLMLFMGDTTEAAPCYKLLQTGRTGLAKG